MSNEEADHITRDAERRQLKRMEAMLDMFEEDRGQPAATMEELREWMGAQYLDQLQIRMIQRLRVISHAQSASPTQRHWHLAL